MPVAIPGRDPPTAPAEGALPERKRVLKLLRMLVEGIALVILAVFLLSNRDAVAVSFWPFGLLGEIALGAVILIALAVGLFAGLMLHWPYRIRAQRRARLAERRAAALQAQLDAQAPILQAPPLEGPARERSLAVPQPLGALPEQAA